MRPNTSGPTTRKRGGRRSAWRQTAAGALLSVCVAAPAQAQSADSTRNRSLFGVGLAFPLGEDVDLSFSAITLHSTSLRANRPGLDFTLGVVPRAISVGVFAAGAKVNVVVPVALNSQTLLLPSVGLTGIGAIGTVGAGGVFGYNGSLALVAFGRPLDDATTRYGLRIGVSLHQIGGSADGVFRLFELGVVRLVR